MGNKVNPKPPQQTTPPPVRRPVTGVATEGYPNAANANQLGDKPTGSTGGKK